MKWKQIKLVVLTMLMTTICWSQEKSADDSLGEVSVEQQEDFSLSYKNRRTKHGALFSVGMEKFYPLDYRSLYNDSYIEDIIGQDRIDLVGLELGYKRNIGPISIAILGTISQGAIDGAFNGAERTINISKYGISANIALDGVFEEPWVAPYAQVGIHQFNVKESNFSGSQSATTGFSFNYRYGLLLQLDWIENAIDKTAKRDRLISSGLENTYLDIYLMQYLASSNAIDPASLTSDGDPNMLSSGEMGLGLKMEF